ASTSQQPITQLKKQRPVSYYHIFPATSADEKAPYSANTSTTNTQTSSLLRDNPNNGVSFSRLSKNFKTNSTSDIATTSGSVAVNTQGKLQQKNASLPDLCSEYLPSGGIIDCAYNVPTNSASLHKVGNIQDLSEAGKTASTSKRSKAGMLRSSDASLLTIHEEHEQPFSAETFSDIRRAMKKINRSRFSEAYQDILSREHSSFAETPSNAPSATRNDSAISKIIRSFEEKGKAASQNLPKDLPSTMHR
ncbi:hypothetical protein, partial [Anaplasma bovis]|uniref:hypothetical protein n=1 Tax=Anaplasma bovis TaxID=186733 RepID=UPI002FF17D36